MPWLTMWVDPVSFTSHGGVTIYHTYNDMEARSGFHRFRFTTHRSDADARFHFDVRALHGPQAARVRNSDEAMHPDEEYALIRDIIHDAIARGVLYGACPRRCGNTHCAATPESEVVCRRRKPRIASTRVSMT
jgi:hypothetical protein